MTIEKRKKRIVELQNGNKLVTIKTYKRFRKELKQKEIVYNYNRKTKLYIQTFGPYTPEPKTKRVRHKKEIQEELVFEEDEELSRIRKSVVLNLRSYDEPYAASIKATTINPDVTEEGLKIAVMEVYNSSELSNIPWYEKKIGFEPPTELGTNEDSRLNDGSVWITTQIRKETSINFIYQ